ncbi:DUF4148 domain-containing protein [Caballeronia sp. LZ035]|uniref:DUF4148 domain-containing protein n=1 Tax=Caballeronia sp. LZ035 TaxID=3038568 RepID=UPI0028668629|nr:DUF4148 domain-containing protein [Caballeronia sp. LZ035]MDR5761067.1 DUF4148 domain-containing protein [Caballeronia sp. LZ035]
MKHMIIGLACLLGAASAPVLAHQDGPDAGRTTAQAIDPLEQAWRDGYLPHRDREYPPTAASIARNKQRHASEHPQDAAIEPEKTGN